jgi:hypothetical protein
MTEEISGFHQLSIVASSDEELLIEAKRRKTHFASLNIAQFNHFSFEVIFLLTFSQMEETEGKEDRKGQKVEDAHH